MKIRRQLNKQYHITGCDHNDFNPTVNRKSCPADFECFGAQDICVKRPIGKFIYKCYLPVPTECSMSLILKNVVLSLNTLGFRMDFGSRKERMLRF